MDAYTLTLDPVEALADDAFYQIGRANPDMKFERSPSPSTQFTLKSGDNDNCCEA